MGLRATMAVPADDCHVDRKRVPQEREIIAQVERRKVNVRSLCD